MARRLRYVFHLSKEGGGGMALFLTIVQGRIPFDLYNMDRERIDI